MLLHQAAQRGLLRAAALVVNKCAVRHRRGCRSIACMQGSRNIVNRHGLEPYAASQLLRASPTDARLLL